eukprot:m.11366 g.11366  ORF g.11366 m.11366 type:complete len:52 (+) comp6426_c0_seq1:34-189(+)
MCWGVVCFTFLEIAMFFLEFSPTVSLFHFLNNRSTEIENQILLSDNKSSTE